jgi:hypothetical protein
VLRFADDELRLLLEGDRRGSTLRYAMYVTRAKVRRKGRVETAALAPKRGVRYAGTQSSQPSSAESEFGIIVLVSRVG